ncbi:MAG: hypothetical protein KDC48_17600, partial [Planctomycetes bacterium]|nr:hypothetical protein [Planctomycetota bacterium]
MAGPKDDGARGHEADEQRPAADTGSALVDLAYRELRDLAGAFLSRERANHTLAPTALVHEAWLRLAGQDRVSWESREHFLAIAAIAMRRVLIDHARARRAGRRGGGEAIEPLATEIAASLRKEGVSVHTRIDLLTLDEGLDRLRERSERASRIV